MKKRRYFIAAAAIAASLCPMVYAAAGITASKLAADKAASSPEVVMYGIDRDISLADDYMTDNSVADLKDRIEACENQIKALRRGAGASDDMPLEECFDKADEMQYTLFSLRADLAAYELEQDENALYAEYADALTDEKQRNEAYSVYDTLRKHEYNGAYLDYLKLYSRYLGQKIDVEQAKADEGYSMQVDADTLRASKASADAQAAEIKADMDYAEKYFELTYGEALPALEKETFTLPDRKKTEKKFAESYYAPYRERQAENIRSAGKKLGDIIADIDSFTARTDGDHKLEPELAEKLDKLRESLSAKRDLQEKQAQKYELQAENYRRELQLYTERLFSQAEVLTEKIAAYDSQISAANEQIRIQTELYNSGMILEHELTEAKVTLKKLTAERTQLICDRDRTLYCLNNGVYIN